MYLAEPAPTYQEASVFLGISLDSVRDREAGILLKFRKELPELREFEPYKDWTKNQKRFHTYRGLVHLPSVEIRHPCFRIRNINGQEVRECITGEDHIAHDGFSLKSWIEDFRSPHEKKDSTEFDIGAV